MKALTTAWLAAALLAGCAGPGSVTSDVASFGDWPAERRPGIYAFDRLPSQQARAEETGRAEAAARPALERAGFRPAAEGQVPDVLVQVGARTRVADRLIWDDPFWWHGGYGYWRYSAWPGRYWGWGYAGYYDRPRYDREVALLLRDRESGKPLFEARASNESGVSLDPPTLAAMFEAALADFPRTGINPRRVTVVVPPKP
jgi:hypothetical protein